MEAATAAKLIRVATRVRSALVAAESGDEPEYVVAAAPRTPEELHEYMRETWGIGIPNEQVCADHVAPFEAFCHAYFARSPICVWHASRGFGGKSALLAALAVAEAAMLGAGVTILGGSAEQSRRVHAYMEGRDSNLADAYWNAPHAPRNLLKSALTAYRTSLKNGGWIHALAGSARSVRGVHPARLRCDEIDEMDLHIFDAAMGQPMGLPGIASQIVASSTHQHPEGTMTEVLRRAAANGWPIFSWCYRETQAGEFGWLSDPEVDRKRSTVTVAMWETEYELQEPTAEGRAFDTESVEAMFSSELGEYEGAQGETHVFEVPTWELDPDWPKPPKWLQGLEKPEARQCRSSRRWRMKHLEAGQHAEYDEWLAKCKKVKSRIKSSYAAGADWGKKQDHTVLWVIRTDCRPMRFVAFSNMRRMPYPQMFGQFNDLVARFDAVAAHDALGVGTAAEDYMEMPTIDYKMVGQQRKDLFSDYIVAVEDRAIRCPRIVYAYTEHRYTKHDDLWGTGHPPDSVVAAAMAWHAAGRNRAIIR